MCAEKRIIMKEFNYTITDPEGIHMRPAGELVKVAKQFESKITISKDGKMGDCKKVFTIMSLAVKNGQDLWKDDYFEFVDGSREIVCGKT